MEIFDRVQREPGISGYCIGKQYLIAGIELILKLFIVRTVFIGLVHAAFQRMQRDLPQPVEYRIGRVKLCLDIKRVCCLQIVRQMQDHRFTACLDLKPDKAESAEPEALIDSCLL